MTADSSFEFGFSIHNAGWNTYRAIEMDQQLDWIAQSGATLVRVDAMPNEWEKPWMDAMVAKARARGLDLMVILYGGTKEEGLDMARRYRGEIKYYVTTSSIDRYALYNDRRSRSSDNTPIKKFNPNGTDILMKTGFFAPIGDVNFDPYGSGTEEATMPSKIREVCLAGEDSYFLVDGEYSKLFYYDEYGNLLYAFGGQGDSLGLFRQLAAVAADGDRLVALDEVDGSLTEFTRTDYGRALEQAVSYQNNRQFDQAIPAWEALIQDNNNLDLAYYNIAKSRMEQGDYREAMEGFRLVDNREYYSKAYKLYRQQQLKRYGGYIALGVLAGIALLAFLFSRLGRLNEKTHRHAGPVKLKRQMAFSVYTMLHPFKGFAEVKAEGRGSVLSASLLLGAAALSSVYQGLGSSYLQKDVDNPATVVSALANLLLPFALWCVANWCVTSLLDGKGTMKDIYIASAYALIPLILVTIPATLLSHLLIQEELVILDMATGLAGFWTVLLMGASLLVVHDYTAGKTLGAALLILAGMVFMLFLVMIFVSLLSQMGVTVTAIIKELSYRM